MTSSFNISKAPVIEDRRLQLIFEKVQAGERLSSQDGLTLFQTPDLLSLGYMANLVRERLHGNVTYFNLNGLGQRADATSAAEKTDVSLLYGRLETLEELALQLVHLRQLQDRTHEFVTFAPIAFDPQRTSLAHLPGTSGFDDIKQIAIARLMLDNIPHIRAYWSMMTPSLAQIAQRFGADDIDATLAEDSTSGDVALAAARMSRRKNLVRLIQECGREPVERDTSRRRVDESESSFNVLV